MNIDIISMERLVNTAIHYGVKFLIAVIVLIIGMWLSNRVARGLKRVMQRRKLDPSLSTFFGSFAGIALKVLVIITVLMTAGVQMTSIVAVLGAASLAVGMALSGTLQNFAGGVVILLFKPFKVGDFIQTATGRMGAVKKIMIFTTVLHTADKQEVFLPNGALSNGEIVNLSKQKARRVEIMVNISYGDKTEVARRVAIELIKKDKRVLKNPEPYVIVNDLAGNWVELSIRFWTTFDDYYDTMWAIREEIYNEFPKHKLRFPFPQLDVHVKK